MQLDNQLKQAMALLWGERSLEAISNAMTNLGYKPEDGKIYPPSTIAQKIYQLFTAGEIRKNGVLYQLTAPYRTLAYKALLKRFTEQELLNVLNGRSHSAPPTTYLTSNISRLSDSLALIRLAIYSGQNASTVEKIKKVCSRYYLNEQSILEATLEEFDAELFDRIDPYWQWHLFAVVLNMMTEKWDMQYQPTLDHLETIRKTKPDTIPKNIKIELAHLFMLQGRHEDCRALLENVEDARKNALLACLTIQAGHWAEGEAQFDTAFKLGQSQFEIKRTIFKPSISWFYLIALIAQGTDNHLRRALKFSLLESGHPKPEFSSIWGIWAHAIEVKLEITSVNVLVLDPANANASYYLFKLWQVLLIAWLYENALIDESAYGLLNPDSKSLTTLRQKLTTCQLNALIAQLNGVEAILRHETPPKNFFIQIKTDNWRNILDKLCELNEEDASQAQNSPQTRLIWSLNVSPEGELLDIIPLEQKHGVRKWNTPRKISLDKISNLTNLPAWDSKVTASIKPFGKFSFGTYQINKEKAIMALIGHPAVSFNHSPDQFIELIEGKPEIEVVQQGEEFVVQVSPPLRKLTPEQEEKCSYSPTFRAEIELMRNITLVQDAPQRLRVIQFTENQRKAAKLLARGFKVPAQGRAELDKALHAITAHFQVQADHVEATHEVAAESRLRAELSPAGESVVLRLVAAPLGAEGPRLTPASGRVRVIHLQDKESIGTRRVLAEERAQVDAVLHALPELDDRADDTFYEWTITDPDAALNVIEQLPKLDAIAGIDWPKGKPVRVVTLNAAHVAINVKSERDWFRVSGSAAVDENLVMQLGDLVAAAQSKSRFIPMGDGLYAALTHSLKQRLQEMAALAEMDQKGIRLPNLAGGWLDDAMEGMSSKTDKAFRAAIERLQAAQSATPTLPTTLQAELRPYQEEGYVWAMRLAQAGMGGCLADDMGLGKTLQALGVLLARAAGGPALVLAPTSVCGNWLAETQRFAPTLAMQIYGDANRETILTEATAGQVIVASYTLFQQAQERFAAVRWHTVIADEAQAIKNAQAKRSQAVFELEADFRLALSGTPVENRLSELWSIMRFAAPGLLSSQPRFTERFANPIERNRDRDAQHLLRRLIAPFILRRTKAQVLQDLPPRTELIYAVAPDAVEAAHYEALRRSAVAVASQALDEAGGNAKLNILVQLTRLRRGACDPRLPTPTYPGPGAKVQAFAQLATELSSNGHKTLVFSQFVDFLALLKVPLEAAGIPYQYLDGSTPAAERTRRVAAFQAGEGDFFLISLKAGGFGLNLTAADYVVITDPWWNPAAEDQAMGRAHRIGQLRPVTVYRMVTKGTVEERIVELHHDKRALADSVLAEGEATALPSTEDLMALIRGE